MLEEPPPGIGSGFPEAADGANEAGARAQYMAARCPNARVADHVAAVDFFGNPTGQFDGADRRAADDDQPAAKTVAMCVPHDPVCSGGGIGIAHGLYVWTGMVFHAADRL